MPALCVLAMVLQRLQHRQIHEGYPIARAGRAACFSSLISVVRFYGRVKEKRSTKTPRATGDRSGSRHRDPAFFGIAPSGRQMGGETSRKTQPLRGHQAPHRARVAGEEVTNMDDEDLKLIRQIVASDGRKYTAGNIDRSRYDRLVDLGWLTPFKTNISDVEYQVTEKGRAASVDNA
jgi:hypothetical protein